MKNLMIGLTVVFSGAAMAHGCPGEMKAIDAKLATQPAMTADAKAQVTTLRADGERLHKAGDHTASMKALADAKKVLGL